MEHGPGGGSVGRNNGEGIERELQEMVEGPLEELRARAGEMGQRMSELIRQRPGAAIAIALGTGFLIGRLLRS
jgi:ElaB/YqjD/DUF883 family membrane-anchored ribosome-binding protein